MTFEELLGDSPRQTAAQWAARAEKEWRGRPGTDFAVELGGGASVGPFAATAPGEARLTRPTRASWVQLADLSGVGPSAVLAAAEEELAGGAQGFWLEAEQLMHLASARSNIRYDFLTLCVSGEESAVAKGLDEVIPPEQRSEMGLLPNPLRSKSAPTVVAQLRKLLPALERRAAVAGEAEQAAAPEQVVAVELPSDYLRAVTLLGAVDLLWANVVGGSGGPIEPLHIVAEIAPPASTTTHEAYLVDASVRAVAAASAGVDALVIIPFSPSREHRRQARNLSHLLQLEAGLHDFGDALRGAAWFEEAIVAAAVAAWSPGSQPA